MALVSLCLMNIFLALDTRFPEGSAFGAATLSNPTVLYAFAWALIGTMLITEIPFLQQIFNTTSLTVHQWGLCLLPGIIFLILSEIYKLILRARRPS